MPKPIANFPNSVWDGTSPARPKRSIDRPPAFQDWDQAVSEIIALENYVIATSEVNVAALQSAVTTAQGNITTLQTQVGTLNTFVSTTLPPLINNLGIPTVAVAPTVDPDIRVGFSGIVFCSADSKIYVWNGAAWVATIPLV